MDSIDQLRIDTPEQIALELPLAGIGSRFLALAIDTLIQSVFYLITAFIFIFTLPLGSSVFMFLPKLVGPALAIFILFAIYWGYFAFFESIWSGQTPGKRYAGIRVIKESGRPINAFDAIGRNLMRAVDGLPGIYGVGLVCMMCNQQSRRLGDFVAGTVRRTREAHRGCAAFMEYLGPRSVGRSRPDRRSRRRNSSSLRPTCTGDGSSTSTSE